MTTMTEPNEQKTNALPYRMLTKIRVSDFEGLDRRVKLTQEDHDDILEYWHNTPMNERLSMREIGEHYGVHRTTISAVISPEKKERRQERHKENCKDGRYYCKERSKKNNYNHLAYKQQLIENGQIQVQ